MDWTKRHTFATIVLVVIGLLAAALAAIALIDPEPPEPYFAPVDVGQDCVPGEPCGVEDSPPPVYCEYHYDEYGEYTRCFDSQTHEELCPAPDGPYYDTGYPEYDTVWEYCDVVNFQEDMEILGVSEDTVGTFGIPALTIVGKVAFTRILEGNKTARIAKVVVKMMDDNR